MHPTNSFHTNRFVSKVIVIQYMSCPDVIIHFYGIRLVILRLIIIVAALSVGIAVIKGVWSVLGSVIEAVLSVRASVVVITALLILPAAVKAAAVISVIIVIQSEILPEKALSVIPEYLIKRHS